MSDIDSLLSLPVAFYDEKPKSGLRSCLSWGPSKAGKTAFGGTWPSPYIIDFDNSLNGLLPDNRHAPSTSIGSGQDEKGKWFLTIDGKAAPFTPFAVIKNILFRLRDRRAPFDKHEIKTLVIDSGTILSKLLLFECSLDSEIGATKFSPDGRRDPMKKKETFDEYKALGGRWFFIFDMVKDLNLNLYMTAHVYTKMDESGSVKEISPAIDGGFRSVIGHRFDAVMYHDRSGKECFCRTSTYGNYVAGIRNWIGPDKIEMPTFEKVFGTKSNFMEAKK